MKYRSLTLLKEEKKNKGYYGGENHSQEQSVFEHKWMLLSLYRGESDESTLGTDSTFK